MLFKNSFRIKSLSYVHVALPKQKSKKIMRYPFYHSHSSILDSVRKLKTKTKVICAKDVSKERIESLIILHANEPCFSMTSFQPIEKFYLVGNKPSSIFFNFEQSYIIKKNCLDISSTFSFNFFFFKYECSSYLFDSIH